MLPEANTDRTAIRLDELYSRLGLETFWNVKLDKITYQGTRRGLWLRDLDFKSEIQNCYYF